MEFQHIQVVEANGWWEATLSRPEALNALNSALLADLDALLARFTQDGAVRGMILIGHGEKAFVAGADIKELSALDAAGALAYSRRGQELFQRIESSGKPVIAAVNGFALGGGLELALACHLRVFSKNAKVGLPEVSLGAIPGYGGTQRLARIVGLGRALEMIATGDPIGADEAHRIGLANRVVEQAELLDACRAIAARISQRGARAVADAFSVALRGADLPLAKGLELEAEHFGRLADSHDWKEGTRAFLEKRKPEFQGR